jgi:DNA-binding XRE family transcriptional regulator
MQPDSGRKAGTMNKLGRYLAERGVKKSAFATSVGASASAISALSKEPPAYWPGRDLAIRIREATDGAITPNDFLPPYEPRPRTGADGSEIERCPAQAAQEAAP